MAACAWAWSQPVRCGERMTSTGYVFEDFAFQTPPELAGEERGPYPCVIVGAGLAGLSLAIDLGMRGVPAVVIDQDASVGAAGTASRGVAYASRTLEFFDRIGIADRIAEKAATWSEGRIFDDRELISHYFVRDEDDQKWPAFLNIQQFYVEEFLAGRAAALDNVEIRWRSTVVDVTQTDELTTLHVDTPEGRYSLRASWVAACDGSNSSMARILGVDPERSLVNDHWAITDVIVETNEDLQRRFWLNVPELNGGAAIVHAMADGLVRCDWQVVNLDPVAEVAPERVRERVAALLGDDREFEIASVGRFRFKRKVLDPMIYGRVIFLGDAAHEIPPFGARGGNGAIQDAENLGWKLAAVLAGTASPVLLATYDTERLAAAHENARCAWQSTFFVNPRTPGEQLFRDAVLDLARRHDFARRLLNTGRASRPIRYADSSLTVTDRGIFAGGVQPGEAAYNGPVSCAGAARHLLDFWRGNFTAVYFAEDWPDADELVDEVGAFRLDHIIVTRNRELQVDGVPVVLDEPGALFDRYAALEGACYVLRPDAHVVGRRRDVAVETAVELVTGALVQAGVLERPTTATWR